MHMHIYRMPVKYALPIQFVAMSGTARTRVYNNYANSACRARARHVQCACVYRTISYIDGESRVVECERARVCVEPEPRSRAPQ